MVTRILSDAIFIAKDIPVFAYRNDYGSVRSGKQTVDYIAFTVSLDQIKTINCRIWEELVELEADVCKVMITHASDTGTMSAITMEKVKAFQPDILFTCYPDEVRRLYPALPTQWSGDVTTAFFQVDSRIVRLKTSKV